MKLNINKYKFAAALLVTVSAVYFGQKGYETQASSGFVIKDQLPKVNNKLVASYVEGSAQFCCGRIEWDPIVNYNAQTGEISFEDIPYDLGHNTEHKITYKVKLNVCPIIGEGKNANLLNAAQGYINGALSNLYSSNASFSLNCPISQNQIIQGDIGVKKDITASNLTISGPSVVTRGGSTALKIDEVSGKVIDLRSYANYNLDFSAIEQNFEDLKAQRAKNLSGVASGVFNLNPDSKPEGGVWKLTNDKINRSFSGKGTIFRDGDLTIDNLSWSGATGTLGLVVKGNLTIKDKIFSDLAIYAYSSGTIKFDYSGGGVDISGSFVGNLIEMTKFAGTIKYAPNLNSYPPPGFSSLVNEISGLE